MVLRQQLPAEMGLVLVDFVGRAVWVASLPLRQASQRHKVVRHTVKVVPVGIQ